MRARTSTPMYSSTALSLSTCVVASRGKSRGSPEGQMQNQTHASEGLLEAKSDVGTVLWLASAPKHLPHLSTSSP